MSTPNICPLCQAVVSQDSQFIEHVKTHKPVSLYVVHPAKAGELSPTSRCNVEFSPGVSLKLQTHLLYHIGKTIEAVMKEVASDKMALKEGLR